MHPCLNEFNGSGLIVSPPAASSLYRNLCTAMPAHRSLYRYHCTMRNSPCRDDSWGITIIRLAEEKVESFSFPAGSGGDHHVETAAEKGTTFAGRTEAIGHQERNPLVNASYPSDSNSRLSGRVTISGLERGGPPFSRGNRSCRLRGFEDSRR